MFDFNGNVPKTLKLFYQKGLPEEFERLDYIESTGTQFLDIGYEATKNTGIFADFQFTSTTAQQRLFSSINKNASGTTTPFRFEFYINGGGHYAYAYNDDQGNWVSTYINANTNRHKLYMNINNSKNIKIDNNPNQNLQGVVTKISGGFTILAHYENGVAKQFSKLKLYSFKITENEEIAIYFIPAKRKSDNEIGLYDVINNIFYTNAGTGEFLGGAYTGDNVKELKYNNITVWKGLPSTYKRLEYIESTGTQYIETNIIGRNLHTALESKCSWSDTSSNLAGGSGSTSSGGIHFVKDNNVIRTGGNFNGYNYTVNEVVIVKVYYDAQGRRVVNVNGNQVSVGSAYNAQDGNVNILKLSNNPNQSGKTYWFKIYNDDTLVFYGIPAKRKSDDVIGLYDVVNDVFYTNSGTGDFIAGNEIS